MLKKVKHLHLVLPLILNLLLLSAAIKAQESIYSVDFGSAADITDWSNVTNVSFATDAIIGNYMIADGNSSSTAPRSANFTTGNYVCVEFDMMLPNSKANGTTSNAIGGGNTGGIALMNGTNVAGLIGFRGSGSGSPDHILSTGGTGSDYVNATAGTKASAYREMWLHYTFLVNTASSKGDFYITNPTDGVVYKHEERYDQYIQNISSVKNIGLVSNAGYAIGIANLTVKEPKASILTMVADNDATEQYLPATGYVSTVQYFTTANYTISYNKAGSVVNTNTIIELQSATIEYSVLDSNGVAMGASSAISISKLGLLTIQPEAAIGKYTVKAKNGDVETSLSLTVKPPGKADLIEITGEDVIISASETTSYPYLGIATAGGIILTDKTILWSIDQDALECTIDATTGIVTIPSSTQGGILTLIASIKSDEITASYEVQILTEEMNDNSTYQIKGAILTDGIIPLSSARGAIEVLLEKMDDHSSSVDQLVVKAFGDDDRVLAENTMILDNSVVQGIQSVPLNTALLFKNASYLKAYVKNKNGVMITKDIEKITVGSYKQIPLISDWLTNDALGNGPGVMNPSDVPVGIKPSTVNTKNLSVNYSYNSNYPEITVDNLLWYKTGAYNNKTTIYDRDGADWEQQALPIGNGYMGGMLFGMPGKDHIQFNEETFWAAGYRGVQNKVAQSYINPNMSEGINGFMNTGNIFVDFDLPNGATVKNYYRDLNIDEAVAHVQYEYDNVTYYREYFSSHPSKTMVFHYSANTEGALNFSVNPISAHPGTIVVNNGEIRITGKLKDSEPYKGGGNAAFSQASDLEYCIIVKVIAENGEIIDDYAKVDVKNASNVTVIVTAATDYDPNQFVIGANGKVDVSAKQYKSLQGLHYAIDKANNRLANTEGKTYAELKSEHIADYQNLFNRVTFSLTNTSEICDIPTNQLQSSYKSVISSISEGQKISFVNSKYKALNQHLEELHYNYARYLMISSSRKSTLPSTLQGKWNQSVSEIWGSCYCININLEMNYWFAGGANLNESGQALIGWLKSQIPAGRVTANNMYSIQPKSYSLVNNTISYSNAQDAEEDDVFIMHTKQSINGQTDKTGSNNIQSPGNMAFLMYNVWDLYKTSGDVYMLEDDVYPILRKAANFYTQYMYANKKTSSNTTLYPKGYYYTTGSGRSPEHGPTQEGVKYDLQLVAGLFDYAIEAAEKLEVDTEKVAVWKEIRENLETPVELGADNQVKEWAQEVKYNKNSSGTSLGDPYHRHISHLVGLYPGNLINRETPEYLEGAKVVLDKRGDDATGWSIANKFLMWARVLDGDKALELFRYQLAQRTYQNLFDYHSPFQIDGNFGSAAGVMELLMQSQTGTIYILPALPNVWESGEISGIKSKTGAKVSINWTDNKAEKVLITPAVDGNLKLGYEFSETMYVNDGQSVNVINAIEHTFIIPDTKAGVELIITFIPPLAVKDLKETSFLLYPNPTNNSITIACDISDNINGYQLSIKDVNAKIIKVINITKTGQEIDLSSIGNGGIYFVTLLNNQSIPVASQKIILQ